MGKVSSAPARQSPLLLLLKPRPTPVAQLAAPRLAALVVVDLDELLVLAALAVAAASD